MNEVPIPDPVAGTDLHEPTDWMAFSHQQLYDMVHNGVDLAGATDVAVSWTSLSDTLLQMSQTLGQALAASADGWQGTAAEAARTSISGLVTWTNNTGENAATVSGCVNRQTDALQAARSAMPTPITHPPVANPPVGMPPVTNPPVGVVQPGSAAQTTTAGFSQPPLAGPGPVQVQVSQYEVHQQAARVMQQYQQSSAANAGTIPQFSAPTSPVNGPIQPPPVGQLPPGGSPVSPHPTTPVLTGSGSVGNIPPEEGEPSRIGTAEPITGSGNASGVGAGSAPASTAEATAQNSRPGMTGGGGMSGAGARRGEDQEHKRKYWQDDDELFDLPVRATPSVIGEQRRG